MKKIIYLSILTLQVYWAQSQGFFYVETGNFAEKPIKEDLLNAFQMVTNSPFASDYTIKTEAGIKPGTKNAVLKIIMEDSATSAKIFETNEEYSFGLIKMNSRILLDVAMKTLIEKNIKQQILCAQNERHDSMMKWVKPRKDKT